MTVKVKRVSDANYKCHAIYEWEGHIIEADDSCFLGGKCYWYCKTLFKGCMFRTLKGIKKAIELREQGELTMFRLELLQEE